MKRSSSILMLVFAAVGLFSLIAGEVIFSSAHDHIHDYSPDKPESISGHPGLGMTQIEPRPKPSQAPGPSPIALPSPKFKLGAGYKFEFKNSDGLTTETFTLPGGTRISVNFPADLSAGDRFTGTVRISLFGKAAKVRASSQVELSKSVLLIGGEPMPASERMFTRTIPSTINQAEPYLVLMVNGEQAGSATVPMAQKPPPTPQNAELPSCGQMGQNIVIKDRCDGVLAPTDTVTIAGTVIQPLAESPRMRVLENTCNTPGATQINYNEQGKQTSGAFQNIGVELSSGNLSLRTGQQTTLTVTARGLNGIQLEATLDVANQSSSIVNMEGGEAQRFVIYPADVSADGTYKVERKLTGIQQGAFEITATVRCQAPAPMPTATPTPSPSPADDHPAPSPAPDATPSACGPAATRTTYSIKDLGELPHPLSSFPAQCIATGVNDGGNVVGACQSKYADSPASGSWHAFRTDAFDVIKPKDDLGFPAGVTGGFSFAMAVNAGGHVVGYWAVAASEPKAFWHDGSTMINLHPASFPLKVSEAYALNNFDDVVGSAWSIYTDKHAVIWPHGDHTMIDLNEYMDPAAKKDWKLIQAYGINDDEHIVGRAMHLKKLTAFLLKGKGAVPEDLGALYESFDVDDASAAYGLNACDEVVGYTFNPTFSYYGFLWKKDSGMTSTGKLPGYLHSYGQAINKTEEVVGASSSAFHHSAIFEGIGFSVGSDPKGVAYSHALWYGGEKFKELKDLNKFIPDFPGWELNLANGINDLGQIAGSGFYKGSGYKDGSLYSKAVLLTPTELVSKLSALEASRLPPGTGVEYFSQLKVGAPVTFFVPFPSSIPCCAYVRRKSGDNIRVPVTHKAYFYLLDGNDKPGANPFGTSISFSFDPTYISMPSGFKIPAGAKYGYFLFTTKGITAAVTTSIKVKVKADKPKPGYGGEAEATITFTITPLK
jgi:probable HAF family extracellular repeat protein